MKTIYGREIIASYEKDLDGEEFRVIVTAGSSTYNIHVISERYLDDEMNTLKLQDDFEDMANVENVRNHADAKKYYSNARLAGYLMEHFIWDRFYNEFGAACVSVEIEAEQC